MDGVEKVSVNLLTNSMLVDYKDNITDKDIIKVVEDTGFGATVKGNAKVEKSEFKENNELKEMKRRLLVSLFFTIPLFI